MILVIILLLVSLGFLTWQLWPVIGDKLQELINFLKNNI
jgi:phosphotransferase system  glucose/maltose/N-acetylglucosamine-specific IIC component